MTNTSNASSGEQYASQKASPADLLDKGIGKYVCGFRVVNPTHCWINGKCCVCKTLALAATF